MVRGSQVQDVGVLAPSSVTAFARGDLPRQPRGRGATPLRTTPSLPARLVTQVPEAALLAALSLAGGDRSRLRFEADGTVWVVNSARPGCDPWAIR